MKKYLHYDLIRILKENTDRDHPMLQKDLLAELRKKDEKINRTTVWNALNDLLANSPETRVHHLGEEAEALSDRIGIMKDGRLLAAGTVEELKERVNVDDFESAFIAIVKEDSI